MRHIINHFYSLAVTGEPSTCMAVAIPFAIREAITAARLESGIPTTSWFNIGKNEERIFFTSQALEYVIIAFPSERKVHHLSVKST